MARPAGKELSSFASKSTSVQIVTRQQMKNKKQKAQVEQTSKPKYFKQIRERRPLKVLMEHTPAHQKKRGA